ncbi:ATP-binding cassette domain-containing protein [Paenibacillus sp. ACRRY]|uniref:ATP-binding cassette domain-containing protein n=1 Tax=Paenibacillus sp. ACRRY TaxID=2918208 RepID=UPI001EF67C5E|nr:ATP-binding cassette domain-containing protein [Paenibacillus sp. ACRRY]MCG7386230.1 ATP-binding cassette domain-containing protein [Paenibacillus sp. ACRRY]
MEPIAVQLNGVSKIRKRRIIGPIDLAIPEGYVVAILGHNGSGKSTLLNMLQRVVLPDSGQIVWFGQHHEGELPTELREHIGFVADGGGSEEDNITAVEAARFRAHWYTRWDAKLFNQLMDDMDVPYDVKLKKLSKGERRKFEIAAALAARPRLLLLDEPSSGLDPFAWKVMVEQFRNFMAEGDTTILIATHIADEVKRLADYIVLMHRGQSLGMAEKDVVLDQWREIWYEGDLRPESIPGAVESKQEAGAIRVITTRVVEAQERLELAGNRIMKIRNLELDEVLQYWIAGYTPTLWR